MDVWHGMGTIAATEVAEPGLAVLDITAHDDETAQEVARALARLWASSGKPTVRRVPGQPGVVARIYVDTRRPRDGRQRALPADWVRFPFPPWGGRLASQKPVCVRPRQDGRPCSGQTAEWPEGFVQHADPGACWAHLEEEEREWCQRAREQYRAAFWALKDAHRKEAGHDGDATCDGSTRSVATPGVQF